MPPIRMSIHIYPPTLIGVLDTWEVFLPRNRSCFCRPKPLNRPCTPPPWNPLDPPPPKNPGSLDFPAPPPHPTGFFVSEPPYTTLDALDPPAPPQILDLLSACPEVWTAFYEARSEAACFHVVHILPRNLLDSPAPTLPPLLNSFC